MREVTFRAGDAGIGVLGLPASPLPIGVVLLNAGAMRRAGPFRLHVQASRHFVALGFPTLRVDQPGIADHVASARCSPLDGLAAILDQLQRETGCERFVVGGVCSAADIAWQLALKDRRVAGLLLLDPLARRTAPGFRVGQWQLLWQRGPRGWIDLVRRRLAPRASLARPSDDQLRDWPASGAEGPQLAALVERGTALFVLYTGGAAAYFTHPRQFFDGFGPATRNPLVHFDYWRDCDHLFFLPEDRERLVSAVGRWLVERFGVRP
jgi:hypothetical protein